MRQHDIRQLGKDLDLIITAPLPDMADEIGNIPGLGNTGQADMLQTKAVADHVDLGLRGRDDQAADAVLDPLEGVAVQSPAVLVVAEFPALVEAAAAFLLLRAAHRAYVVVVGAAAGVVHAEVEVVWVAVVLEEVVAAGFDHDVQLARWRAAVAHGAVEGVGESGGEEEEEGGGVEERWEVDHGELCGIVWAENV